MSALEALDGFVGTLPRGSLMISHGDRIVAQWGDIARRVKSSSLRKSLLSALIGIAVRDGDVALPMSLEQLGIDDIPPLTRAERQATVSDILKARSGIYRGFVNGTPEMRKEMPAPGSHPPGTQWCYNNWDFNVAGTIFEKQSGVSIGRAFHERIARPIGMQDFREQDVYYVAAKPGTPPEDTSVHPAYQFEVSARDVLKFGQLFLQGGHWNGAEVVPPCWVEDSTKPWSETGEGAGYGYFWWIDDWPGVAEPHYTAKGALGKVLTVFPDRKIVVVYLNFTEYPDDTDGISKRALDALPKVTKQQMSKLLNLVLAAAPDGGDVKG